MRRSLLDTPLLAAYLLNRPVAVELLSPWIRHREAATSVLVYGAVHEFILGRANYAVLHGQLRALLQEIQPHFLTYPSLRRYGEIRRALRRANSLIGDIDTLIAATAIDRDLTLVTADGDFQWVPGLKLTLVPRSQLGRIGTR